MSNKKVFTLSEKMEEKYNNKFKSNTPREINFRLYNKFVKVKKRNDRIDFETLEYSKDVLNVINNKLFLMFEEILKRDDIFDKNKYDSYVLNMKKNFKNMEKEYNLLKSKSKIDKKSWSIKKNKLQAYLSGLVVGSNWTKDCNDNFKNKVGIILNQIDMASKLINIEMRTKENIKDLEKRYEESIKNSGFNINKNDLECFIKKRQLSNSDFHNEIYVCFLAYIITTKVVKDQLITTSKKFEDHQYEKIFETYYEDLKTTILGDKNEI